MACLEKFFAFITLLTLSVFLINCGTGVSTGNSGTSGSTSGSGSGSGTGSGGGAGSGSGSGSGGSGAGSSIPGYGAGTGASGQTAAAKFLYANPLPGGGPFAASIQTNGVLTATQRGSANNLNPNNLAIDPSGSFIFQTAQGFSGGTQGGIFVYAINRANGSLGPAIGSYLSGQPFYADVVDNQGKFLYAQGSSGVYAFNIQSGTGVLIEVPDSPFAVGPPSSPGYSQPATLMAVDQTNHFLYVSTNTGIWAFTINQNSGQLTSVTGSPFGGSDVTDSWTIVITPTNSYLYELQSQNTGKVYGYSINQTSGALSPLSSSPFISSGCGNVTPSGTIGIPGPDNMTIASAGKFMYDNCGIYAIDESTGDVTQVSTSGPGDWPVISPSGNFLWAITSDQQSCFSCDVGVMTYQVNAETGALTAVPNSFLLLTNSEVGSAECLAITK
jgi:6-phosphogluconolactonase (cycloisomerase 2 family)